MSDSGKFILKFIIVFVIFPSIAYLASILSGFVLVWPLMLLPKSSQAIGFTVLKVATTAIGIVGGFLISWRVWPREAVADLNDEVEQAILQERAPMGSGSANE